MSDQPYSTMRGEFQGPWMGGLESSRALVEQRAHGFRGEISVPVWTSQLFVSDWLQPSPLPMSAHLQGQEGKYQVTVQNHLNRKLNDVRLAARGKVYNLGEFSPNQTKSLTLDESAEGIPLRPFVDQARGQFASAVQFRRQALGDERRGRLEKSPDNAIAASFVCGVDDFVPSQQYFVAPRGVDVSAVMDRGDAVLFAWTADHSLISPIHQFTPRRTHRDTLLRLAVPLPLNK